MRATTLIIPLIIPLFLACGDDSSGDNSTPSTGGSTSLGGKGGAGQAGAAGSSSGSSGQAGSTTAGTNSGAGSGGVGGSTAGTEGGGTNQGGTNSAGTSNGGSDPGGTDQGGSDQGGAAGSGQAGGPSKGPAYDAGTASCPAEDGTRRIKLVNNCTEVRWFKLDGRTTPLWARPDACPWKGTACSDLEGVGQCTEAAKQASPGTDPGLVYCKAQPDGSGACACNPHFELAPGQERTIELPADAAFPSGTGWLAEGCNALGAACSLGNEPARNSVFEFTYDKPGQGALYYDISAVNAWTTASSVGMKSCGGAPPDPNNVFWCRGTGCRFNVETQCPDGSESFAPGPAGCSSCPTAIVNGKQVLAGSCGSCPDGHSGNHIPTGTVFNASNIGGNEWTWQGDPNFVDAFGYNEGAHANRRFDCGPAGCSQAAPGQATTCLGGCDLCTLTRGVPPQHEDCIKYCCPDQQVSYNGATFRYDSAGCTAIGVQAGTDYSVALKGACPYVYTFGYEDHSSTFQCATSASLLIQACPDAGDFPSSL